MEEHLDIEREKVDNIVIVRAHRLNPRKTNSPVIAKFLKSSDKSFIFKKLGTHWTETPIEIE